MDETGAGSDTAREELGTGARTTPSVPRPQTPFDTPVRLGRHVHRIPLSDRGVGPMRRALCATSAAILVGLATVAGAGATGSTDQSLVDAINGVRAAHGLGPVRLDPTLEQIAAAHTQDMLRRDYFAHGAFATRVHAAGARGPVLGENLAWSWGAGSGPAEIVDLWLGSPEHRRNLLRPGFTRIGIGALHGTFLGHPDSVVVTADFAGR